MTEPPPPQALVLAHARTRDIYIYIYIYVSVSPWYEARRSCKSMNCLRQLYIQTVESTRRSVGHCDGCSGHASHLCCMIHRRQLIVSVSGLAVQ
jgi:hypothetical protein